MPEPKFTPGQDVIEGEHEVTIDDFTVGALIDTFYNCYFKKIEKWVAVNKAVISLLRERANVTTSLKTVVVKKGSNNSYYIE